MRERLSLSICQDGSPTKTKEQESTTEHQKSLCLHLYRTARKEHVTVHGLVLARVRLAPEGVNRNVSYNGGALGLPAGVSAHMGRTVFLNDTPRKREEPNPHTGQRNLSRSCVPWIPPALMSTGEDPGAGADRL